MKNVAKMGGSIFEVGKKVKNWRSEIFGRSENG
jgi:hypothetical protein